MTLTHLENGGWTIAELRRLSVHEVDEDAGAVLHAALTGADPGSTSESASEVLEAAVTSGVLVEEAEEAPVTAPA